MVNQAKSQDVELRERLSRRRSSWISPSIPSLFSDQGEGRASGLTTAVKIDSMGVPADDPRRCGDSDPRCAVDLELGLPLCPIVEEVGLDWGQIQNMELSVVEKRSLNEGEILNRERSLAGDEFQTTDGDTRSMMEDGQASSVLPDSLSQVVSYPSPLLPLEIATVGLEELGEGFSNYVQEEDLLLGVPLMAGTGRDSLRTEAGHVEPAIPLTPVLRPIPPLLPPVISSALGSGPIVAGEVWLRRTGHEDEEVFSKAGRIGSAKSEDVELRERLSRRRSSWISPSIPSLFSDQGEGRASGLTTAVKIDSIGVPADDPRRCGDSDPRCAVDLELGLPLSPIVEEVGLDWGQIQNMELSVVEKRSLNEGEILNRERSLAGDEFQTTDGDTRPMMEDGQASSVLPDSLSQVFSYPSPLLPLEIATVGLEELGEGFANYVQEEDLPLGVPLMARTGRDSLRTEAGHVKPAIPLTPGASVASGDRGGSGLSYASAV
ncbi:hypothetical protein Dimus_029205, partial [Dionaea muscipula]